MAACVVIVFLFYVGDRLWDREIERRLIRDGVSIQAKMVGNGNKAIHGQTFVPGDIINVEFDWKGQDIRQPGPLHHPAAVGEVITIHVDPNDPAVWTDLSETEPLLASMFVGFLFLPVAPIVFFLAWLKQKTVRAQWENGEAMVAVVDERRQTPVAPLCYAIRCSFRDQRDKRLFTVYVPPVGKLLEPGSEIWVIGSFRQARPVAAMWFE